VSHALYATRLYWSGTRGGIAKLHGRCVQLHAAPHIAGRAVTWRDMTDAEVAEADAVLRAVVVSIYEVALGDDSRGHALRSPSSTPARPVTRHGVPSTTTRYWSMRRERSSSKTWREGWPASNLSTVMRMRNSGSSGARSCAGRSIRARALPSRIARRRSALYLRVAL
jgi:hypothetical protein